MSSLQLSAVPSKAQLGSLCLPGAFWSTRGHREEGEEEEAPQSCCVSSVLCILFQGTMAGYIVVESTIEKP